tara:strand:- start:583 stop:1524 length:942 start_codon:yes stop_codon:yes gene_type:complete
MRRKVVKHGPATYIISLPSKWVKRYNIAKGDELELEEEGKTIVISTERGNKLGKVEVDLSGLDRTSIIYKIRSLYKLGYDELNLTFDNQSTTHYRLKDNKTVVSVINEEVSRLPGMELLQQRTNNCIVKSLSELSFSEFDTFLRRIFLLLMDASNDLATGILTNDKELLRTIEEKHNNITRFINFCQRLLNKHGFPDYIKTCCMLKVILVLDKTLDTLKNTARIAYNSNMKEGKNLKETLFNVNAAIKSYYELFYKFDNQKVQQISQLKDTMLKNLQSCPEKLSKEEFLITGHITSIIELIAGGMEARIALEY